jgi:hypothetical protein
MSLVSGVIQYVNNNRDISSEIEYLTITHVLQGNTKHKYRIQVEVSNRSTPEIIPVDSTARIYSTIEHVFSTVRENVSISNADIEIISLKITDTLVSLSDSSEVETQMEFHLRREVPEPVKSHLSSLLLETFAWDSQLTRNNIQDVSFLFSTDDGKSSLHSVTGSIDTTRPHLKYDLESVSEYINYINEEIYNRDLESHRSYEIPYSFVPPPTIASAIELCFHTVTEQTISTTESFASWLTIHRLSYGDLSNTVEDTGIEYMLHLPLTLEENEVRT